MLCNVDRNPSRLVIARATNPSAGMRAKWQLELARARSATLDAPSWLWSSVVELVAAHEAAYLDHCRFVTSRAA